MERGAAEGDSTKGMLGVRRKDSTEAAGGDRASARHAGERACRIEGGSFSAALVLWSAARMEWTASAVVKSAKAATH